ncbi:MAG: ATP-dependent zinc metalloprotease FtsH [Clostridia bacterium]|nr:ATP-dependent zinc metalloprotease FtsH [Clostridia bacterium]
MDPKNKKKIRTLLIWLVIFGAILFMTSGMDLSKKTVDELDYNTEFLQLAKSTEEHNTGDKTIKAVRVVYRDVYGLYGTSETTLKELEKNPAKKADFHVIIPSENTFRADMSAIVYGANAEKFKSVDEVSSADYSFRYSSGQVEESIWSLILPYLIMFGGVGLLYFFMMRSQGGGKQMMNFGKSHARMLDDDKNRVTFADVAGADEEKEELKEVVEFMRNPERYNKLGARIPKGVLLVGPPGTGKTLLAKAVAGEAKVPFFSISGSDFVEMFVGVGASRVRDLFQTAKKATPAVVFIDEIDAVGRQRGAGMGGGHDEREQTLNQLLVEMDGFAVNEGIIVIAATNRPDILDRALLRPGRFDRQITVNYPDIKGREEILKVHAKNKPIADDVSLKVLAQRTPGFTGADLANVLNEAALLSARNNDDKIRMSVMEEAITRVQMGPEKKSRVVTPEDKKLTAYHEAGHAIVAIKMENCDEVHEVSIIPRGSAGGYTMMLPNEQKNYMTRGKILDSIAMALGGRVAEKLRMDDISTGAYSDLQHATESAHRFVTEYGMSEEIGPVFLGGQTEVFIGRDWGQQRNYSESLQAKVDDEVRKILNEQFRRAEVAVGSDMEGLDRVATALMQYERMSGEQFKAIYFGEDAEKVMGAAAPKSELPADGGEGPRGDDTFEVVRAETAECPLPAENAASVAPVAEEEPAVAEAPAAEQEEPSGDESGHSEEQ